MKNFKLLSLFVCLICVFTKLALAEKVEVKIGALLALSGDFAPLGSEVLKGIKLGLAESNNSNLLLQVEDIGSLSPKVAVTAAQKLINVNKIDLGLTMIVEEAEPIAPIFSKANIPLLVAWDSNEAIKNAGRWIFSNGFSTELSGKKMARFVYKKKKLLKISIVRHNDSYSNIISDAFKNEFVKLGGKIIIDESFNPGETDYRSAISKIKASKSDSIYLPLVPMNSSLFLKQLKQLGVKLPLFSADSMIPDVVKAAGKAAEGVYLTNNYTDKEDKLNALYKSKYKSSPFDVVLVSLGYDVVKIALKAIADSSYSPDSIRYNLEQILGEERSADRKQRLYQIINGNYILVKDK